MEMKDMESRLFYLSDLKKLFVCLERLMKSRPVQIIFSPASKKMDLFGKSILHGELPSRIIDSSNISQITLYENFKLRNVSFVEWTFKDFSVQARHAHSGYEIKICYSESMNFSSLLRDIFLESREGHLIPEFSKWGDYRLIYNEMKLVLSDLDILGLAPISNLKSMFPNSRDVYGDELEEFSIGFYNQENSVDALIIEEVEEEKSGDANALMHYGFSEPYDSFEIISLEKTKICEIPDFLMRKEGFITLRFWYNNSFYSIDHDGIWIFS